MANMDLPLLKRNYPIYRGCLIQLVYPPIGSSGRQYIPPVDTKGTVVDVNKVEYGQALVQWSTSNEQGEENRCGRSWCPMQCLRIR